MNNNPTLSKKDIKRSFDHAADTYDEAAFLQREVAKRLLERLDYIRINPKVILDLGAGTGYATRLLEQRYKKSKVIAVDFAEKMLKKCKANKRWFDRKRYVCADAETLPFTDHSFDLIFSNLMLHWCDNIETSLAEIKRVLKPNGLLLFSTLGPDTLYELRQSWSMSDTGEHVHQFIDMHKIGDFLQRQQFRDPVVDMEFITLTYNELRKIFLDLKHLGTHNQAKNRTRGLTGKRKFATFVAAYEQYRDREGHIPVTYEVIYGIGWGRQQQQQEQAGKEYAVPIESITKKDVW